MGGSLRIARVAGIDIKVHISFLLIVLWGAFQWGSTGVNGALFGVLITLAVFACVVLHELGHSLVAKAFGIPVRDITLLPIGGVAHLGRRPETPGQELLIAGAGPAVNVFIAMALFVSGLFLFGWPDLGGSLERSNQPSLATFWTVLTSSNVVLAVFNLIPAFPMDGGRILRAVLSWFTTPERATRAAALVGRVIAVLFFLGFPLSPMLPFIGLFIFFTSGAEVFDADLTGTLRAIRAGDAVNPYSPRFTPATTVGEAVRALGYTPIPAFAVEHFGRLVGVVTRPALITAAREESPSKYVAGLMMRQVPTVQSHESLDVVRTRMQETQLPCVAVFDQELFLGLVTDLELTQHMVLAHELRTQIRGGRTPGATYRPGERRP